MSRRSGISRSFRTRALLAIAALLPLAGCGENGGTTLSDFVADFARSLLAALLL